MVLLSFLYTITCRALDLKRHTMLPQYMLLAANPRISFNQVLTNNRSQNSVPKQVPKLAIQSALGEHKYPSRPIGYDSALREPQVSLEYISGVSWPPTPEYIPDPSHGRVFCEKFRSVYVMKGVWSLLTDMLLNRTTRLKTIFFDDNILL